MALEGMPLGVEPERFHGKKDCESSADASLVTREPLEIACRAYGDRMRMSHHSHRTVATLQEVVRLTFFEQRWNYSQMHGRKKGIRERWFSMMPSDKH
jgi:hypothetical protein